jgi:hypothetical protein
MEIALKWLLGLVATAVVALVGAVLKLNSRVVRLETIDVIDYRGLHEALKPIEDQVAAIAIKVGATEDRRHER